jgi:hypothetical protein
MDLPIGRLVPAPGAPGALLSQGVAHLPEIMVSARNERIALGRNSVTKIVDPNLSRRECTLTALDSGVIAIMETKNVLINDKYVPLGSTMTLKDGDKISLRDDRYSYLVRYRSENKATHVPQAQSSPRKRNRVQSAAAKTPVAATLSAPTGSSVLPKDVTEELYCSLCLELQVEPVAIIPCGHSFCKACAKQVTQCPNCRNEIKGVVPNLSFANIISGLASTSLLPYDDVMAFDERTPAQKRVQRQCGKSEDDAILID